MVAPGSHVQHTDAMRWTPACKSSWAGGGPIDGLSRRRRLHLCGAQAATAASSSATSGSNDAALACAAARWTRSTSPIPRRMPSRSRATLRAVATMGREAVALLSAPCQPIFDAVALDSEAAWLLDFRATLEGPRPYSVAPPGMWPDRGAYCDGRGWRRWPSPTLLRRR